jgi:cell wall-associated NlpC family hydrolase
MNRLVELVKQKVGCGYVWGSQGEILSMHELARFIANFGKEHYYLPNGITAERWLGREVFDCSGLIVWAFRGLGIMDKWEDATAEDLFRGYCEPIGRQEVQEGDLVFRKADSGSIVHVGVALADGRTIEAEGTATGVVYGDIDSFNMFGRVKHNLGYHTPLVARLISLGVVRTPEYWDANLVAGGTLKADYVMSVLENLIKKIP